ncbi:hypothetical protein H0H92_003884 [Tricholoma furcatifolium]|nr:hypothetical protein H0H92_003884 [Tricholoma furcatifolium]
MSEKQQQLVYAIIEFLNQSIADGTVKSDDKEGLEVAIQCIGEAFNVDPSDQQQVEKLTIKPATLQSLFDVYLKTRSKMGSTPQASTSQPKAPTADDKAKADAHKQTGNSLMSAKQYDEAIESYDKAVALDPSNPVYYSNRAAAYSSKGDHLSAVGDAEKAISIDPKYVKGYHRLGHVVFTFFFCFGASTHVLVSTRHAYFSLGDFSQAEEAFERGLVQDPSNAGLSSGLQATKERIAASNNVSSPATTSRETPAQGGGAPNFGGMADMLRGMGGAGGGMPDMSTLLNNPQLMNMAQQMMANGGLASLMQNPGVANMMNRMQNGDMPSMEELMRDPTMRDLANQFGAGMGGR